MSDDYQKGQDHDGLLEGFRPRPALTLEEWAVRRAGTDYAEEEGASITRGTLYAIHDERDDTERGMHRIIALANDALPNSDPRKITRERVVHVRRAIGELVALAPQAATQARADSIIETARVLVSLADALESYLQPEK